MVQYRAACRKAVYKLSARRANISESSTSLMSSLPAARSLSATVNPDFENSQ
jgi:hypothetical protein